MVIEIAVAKSKGVMLGAKKKSDQFQIQSIMNKRKQYQGYGTILQKEVAA